MDAIINNLKTEIAKIEALIHESAKNMDGEADSDMKNMYNEEIKSLEKQKAELENSLESLETGPSDKDADDSSEPINQNTAILEVRAGTGGNEAGLFARDLYKMYTRYAEKSGWKTQEVFLSENEIGGIKTVSVEIRGLNAYNLLKNESGVHRVQRVPITEAGGRIHTSTATIAVLPQLKKLSIEIKPEDLKWEFFRAGGHGGQNVNKVSTAVRLTHIPTNTLIECQEERSQGKNRDKALGILQAKLYTIMHEQQVKNISDIRTNQIGSAERSEKIRTYNYPQDRVTDHRINESWHGINIIMLGNIDNILEKCSSLSGDHIS